VFVAGEVRRHVPGNQTAAEVVAYNPATGAELWHPRGTAAYSS
jgi:hypothetical protein